jgi:hypothetical protein
MSNRSIVLRDLEWAGEAGKIFTVWFVKKNGEIRKMTCRLGVQWHSDSGRSRSWDPLARGYLTVYDMVKRDYRMVNLQTTIALKGRGEFRTYANSFNQEDVQLNGK